MCTNVGKYVKTFSQSHPSMQSKEMIKLNNYQLKRKNAQIVFKWKKKQCHEKNVSLILQNETSLAWLFNC